MFALIYLSFNIYFQGFKIYFIQLLLKPVNINGPFIYVQCLFASRVDNFLNFYDMFQLQVQPVHMSQVMSEEAYILFYMR